MAKLIDVIVPVGQAEGTESVVSTWFKSVGDVVAANEPLLEISTDKVNMEVASPGTGRLAEILKNDGEQVEPGEVLGRVDVEARRVARRFRALADDDAAALGRHVTRGDLSVADIAERLIVSHLEGHVSQLRESVEGSR